MRAELSKKFQAFFKKIEEETNNDVEFEVPYSDLAFEGAYWIGTNNSAVV